MRDSNLTKFPTPIRNQATGLEMMYIEYRGISSGWFVVHTRGEQHLAETSLKDLNAIQMYLEKTIKKAT